MTGGAEEILLDVLLILVGAKIGAEVATRLGQPSVAGEITVGILLGPSLLGWIPSFEFLTAAEDALASGALTPTDLDLALNVKVLAFLAELGVLLLLFEVGLESNLADFRRVGASAALVGTLGVVISLIAGAGVSYLLATRIDWVLTPNAMDQPYVLHVFVGAILTATSVGITARVLKDLGKIQTKEAQIILGAAVFDDVLGLIVLAIVGGLVTNPESLSATGILEVFAAALGFFFAAIILGVLLAPRLIDYVHRLSRTPFIHVGFAVSLMLLAAYLATAVGLAAIVGAFAAGLALSTSVHREVIFDHIKPVASLFVGFFFVVLGVHVDRHQIPGDAIGLVLLAAAALTLVGILAKLMAGWGVVGVRASRYVVGVGMVPRGEVGLIFAVFGLEHQLLTNWQYASVILVVLATTLITPFWLKAVERRFVGQPTPTPAAARVEEVLEP